MRVSLHISDESCANDPEVVEWKERVEAILTAEMQRLCREVLLFGSARVGEIQYHGIVRPGPVA